MATENALDDKSGRPNIAPRVFVLLDQQSENERLWEQPFQACAIDADCAVKFPLLFQNCLLPESLVFDRWSRGTKVSGNEVAVDIIITAMETVLNT